jgi:hypothetical protein
MSIEFTLDHLNSKQKVLADIIWSFQEFDQVEKFIASLGGPDQMECRTIIELMKISAMDQSYDDIGELDEAKDVLKNLRLKK